MHLTASDWSDLRLTAIVLPICILLEWLLMLSLRWRKPHLPVLIRLRLVDPWLILFVVWLFTAAPMLVRRGLPWWLSIAVLVAIFLAPFVPGRFSLWRDRPVEESSSGKKPRILISKEEISVSIFLTLALSCAVAMICVLVTWVIPPDPLRHDLWGEMRKFIAVFATIGLSLAVFIYGLWGTWPGRISRRSRIDIKAKPSQVWDAIVFRDGYPGWKKTYAGIERLEEPGEVYRLHHATDANCIRCGLPKQPDRPQWSSRIEVLKAKRTSIYHHHSRSMGTVEGKGDAARLLKSEETIYLLKPIEDGGGTRLTYKMIVDRPKAWLALLILLGGPIKEHLGSLKAHLEAMPDESLYGIAAKRIEAARNAPRHCGCPAAV